MLKCKAVFQYPKNFNNLPIISYYTVTECGGFYADNDESIQDGHIQIDIWAEIPKECSDLSAEVNEVMTKDSWVRRCLWTFPKMIKKIYHKTMRFQKVFYVIKIYLFKTKYEKRRKNYEQETFTYNRCGQVYFL
mgnify:CR=1 FL=1